MIKEGWMNNKLVHDQVLDSIGRIHLYTGNPVCRTLSLALDLPEIFDMNDKDLLEALSKFEGMLEFNNISFEDTDEEDTL
jgi:hypothetical protein